MSQQTESTNLDILARRHTAADSWKQLLAMTLTYTPSLYAYGFRGREGQRVDRERERLARALERHGRRVWRGSAWEFAHRRLRAQ